LASGFTAGVASAPVVASAAGDAGGRAGASFGTAELVLADGLLLAEIRLPVPACGIA